jgi:hypothetical protein
VVFSFSGIIMAGSFGVADPERLNHWQHVAYVYMAMLSATVLSLVISMALLWRKSREAASESHKSAT